MKADEILKAAQDNPDNVGEHERYISTKALLWGFVIGIGSLIIMIMLELVINNKIDFGKPFLLFFIGGIIDFYDGLVRKKKLNAFLGIALIILSLFFLLAYIGVLLS